MANQKFKTRLRILAIEDDPGIQTNIELQLQAAGYAFESAMTIEDGRGALQSNPPDLLILDIMLPDGNGLDFLEEIRGNTELCNLPVLIFTALNSGFDVDSGAVYGSNAYITKPFRAERLLAAVEQLLSKTHATGAHH